MTFKLSRRGILLIVVAVFGTLFAAMPLMGLGADVSPEADGYLEQRYGDIGLVLAVAWVTLMAGVALAGVVAQFRPPRQRRRRARR